MSQPATVRFEDDEYDQLRRLAERRGVTVSELIREAVRSQLFRRDRTDAVQALVGFIDENPIEIEDDVDELERRITESMGRDAAPR